MLKLSTIYVNAIYLTRFGSLSYFGECIWLFHNKLYMDHFSFCYIFETRSFLWAALFFYSCFLFCSEASLISLVIFSAIQFCIASSFSFSPCYSRHLNYNLEEQIFICWWRLPLPPITQALLYLQSSVPLLLQLGLEILAFPCNQSAGQEPGSNWADCGVCLHPLQSRVSYFWQRSIQRKAFLLCVSFQKTNAFVSI